MLKKFWESNDNQEENISSEVDEALVPETAQGKIFHLNREKGWGFISSDEPTLKFRRIFFHWTTLVKDTLTFEKLEVNMKVEFNPDEGQDGWKAFNVRIIQNEENK